MAAKNEGTPAPAAAPAAAPAPAAPAAPAAGPSKIAGLIPVILVVILAPVVSWAVAQFVIIPKMEERLGAAVAKVGSAHGEGASDGPILPATHEAAAGEHGGGGGEGGHGGGAKKGEASGATNSYEFSNMVVNLAGTMGTRYLKVTFQVVGKDATLRDTFNMRKPQMVDITLNVLSSLTLTDLEEAGAKNIIREKLVNAYNQALGKRVAEQIYFSDFVVQ